MYQKHEVEKHTHKSQSGSAYEGGVFFLGVIPAPEFPWRPPKCYFLTPIFHPNVASDGEILLDCLSDQWTPSPGLATRTLYSQSHSIPAFSIVNYS